jgi:anti-sigma regulatory factor (Ser/Thr protein kinase)
MEPLTVPGTLDSLGPVADYVKMAAAEAGLDKKASYRLRLAVDEIATNIVTHGYAEAGREGNLTLQADIDRKVLTISIEDTGVAYEPQIQPPDGLDSPLEERQIGGLGVYLAIQNVDKFHYERAGGRNRHTFIVTRTVASTEN